MKGLAHFLFSNLKFVYAFALVPLSFMLYWKLTGATDAPYKEVWIALGVLVGGLTGYTTLRWMSK